MKTLDKKDLDKAINKVYGVQYCLDKGIISHGSAMDNISIHFLLWHSLSEIGRVKFVGGIHFYLKVKAAQVGKKEPDKIRVMVDYGEEMNEYGKIGVHLIGIFIPNEGILPYA
ncbi:MAG: hypothetical protein IJW56_02485 [Bacteroides sp.]|nr:hypothetical protein [Bacteroides sp.]